MIRGRQASNGTSSSAPLEKKCKPDTSVLLQQTESERCNLVAFGLRASAIEFYSQSGVKTLHPWQVECLNVDKGACIPSNANLPPRNLVYSAPTSGGKSMVAEILVLKTLCQRNLKSLVIVPFVSIVLEKEAYFSRLLGEKKMVAAFHGANGTAAAISEASVLVCTIEKAGWVFARMNDLGISNQLGLVVADEVQMIGTEPERGKFLESLISRVHYGKKVGLLRAQIVAMSATVPNLDDIAKWIDAALYTTQYRPVPLCHQIVSPSKWIMSPVYSNERIVGWKRERKMQCGPRESDVISQLCVEGNSGGYQCIVFCHMRRACSAVARIIAEAIGEDPNNECHVDRLEIIEEIRSLRLGEDSELFKTIRSGVAFHHAGLSSGERAIIEAAYRKGKITVMVATTTLACGVNLPCKRVIFRDPSFNGRFMSPGQYQQMSGRAGRKGYDDSGESFILCMSKDSDLMQIGRMITDPPPKVTSSIEGLMGRTVLEVFVSGLARTRANLGDFLESTLMATQGKLRDNPSTTTASQFVDDFLDKRILVENDDEIRSTDLGRAIYSSSLSPEEGLLIHEDILKHRTSMRFDTDLQILFLLAPCAEWRQPLAIDWEKFYAAVSVVREDLCRGLGICESQVQHIYRNQSESKLSAKELLHFRRFYAAFIMSDVVNEVPTTDICRKFNTSKGALEGLQDIFSMRASQIGSFCEHMKGTGWNIMEFVMKHYLDRLCHGVQPELLALSKIPFVKGHRARVLYQAGFRGVEDVANSTEQALFEALSKTSRKNDSDERRVRMRNRIDMSAARKILKAALDLTKEGK